MNKKPFKVPNKPANFNIPKSPNRPKNNKNTIFSGANHGTPSSAELRKYKELLDKWGPDEMKEKK